MMVLLHIASFSSWWFFISSQAVVILPHPLVCGFQVIPTLEYFGQVLDGALSAFLSLFDLV